MHFRGGNHLVIQLQIASRTGVLRDAAIESKVSRGTRGGIDAHMSHHARDDQLIDVALLELVQERRFTEPVRVVFLTDPDGNSLYIQQLKKPKI